MANTTDQACKGTKPERSNGYTDALGYRRIRVNGAEHYEHRYVWEQAHGPIPAGHHIHHRDHDRANNALWNLECVEGRAHFSRHLREWWAAGVFDNRNQTMPLDDAYIVHAHESGVSFRKLAKELGASHTTVASHYHKAVANDLPAR